MAVIRALTIHIPKHVADRDFMDEAVRRVTAILEHGRELLRRYSLDCWSFRASFPAIKDPGNADLNTLVNYLSDFSNACNLITAGLHLITVKDVNDYSRLVESLMTDKRLYGSVLVSDVKHLDWYVECLSRFSSEPEVFSRLALIYPKQVLTPYFPASTSYDGLWGISVALRYVDLVKEFIMGIRSYGEIVEYVKKVYELCKELEFRTGVACYGLDLSLSPWMQESVGELIELVSHTRIPNPGSGWAIFKLNKLIKQLIHDSGIDAVGFNEVMLPVAEDSLLKERVLELELSIADLAHFTAFCVAGVDMVATYLSNEEGKEELKKLLYDTYAIALTRGKSIGIRLIPAVEKPGNSIKIDRFGIVPIAKIR